MKKINVLVFPDGEINSVELHDALSTCVNINLYGASSIERHGKYIFKNHISGLPNIFENNFYDKLNDLIEKYAIEVIIPTHDTVSLELIRNNEKIKCKVLGGDKFTAEICRSKIATYKLFNDCSFVPTVYKNIENVKYPVFIKPDKGQGAQGAKLIKSIEDIINIPIDDYVLCEYLPGEEYTVDCLTDKNGKLCFVSSRSRQRTFAGVSVHGKIERLTPEIYKIADTINDRLNFCGLWYFQIKKDRDGIFKLLEVSNRCAGTMCLTRARGVNLPLLSVYTIMGYEISVQSNSYNVNVDRTLISRYEIDYDYDTVYFDLDDTLIVNDKVNLTAIRFLYQCKNKKMPVHLLTKHAYEVNNTLERFSISKTLFSSIIHIPEHSNKSEFINSSKAILIDNAYTERREVFKEKKIPVFDVDAIEVLLDWKS